MATPDTSPDNTSPEAIPQTEVASGTPEAPVVAGAAIVADVAPDTGRRGKFAGRRRKFTLLVLVVLAVHIFVLIGGLYMITRKPARSA